MKIEIDQSGKIENTNKLSIIALVDGFSKTLLISAKDKKSIQVIFRRIHQPRVFISKVFAACIYFLVKDDIKKIDTIMIDNEYPGYEKYIRRLILEYFEDNNYKTDKFHIYFRKFGKKSKAHDCANKAYKAKRADIRINKNQVLDIIFK
jgi:hypothetical protein